MKILSPLEITILVVDDNADIRQATVRLLEKAGYPVRSAASGEEALAEVRRQPPDLLLTDRDLPGIDGLEVCRQVKQNPDLKDCLVVIISAAYANPEHQAEGWESGADGYIARPIANRELLARVEAYARILSLTRSLQAHVAQLEHANEFAQRSRLASLNLMEEALATRDQLASVNRALNTINACHQAMAQAADEPALLADICRLMIDSGGYRMAWIGFANADEANSVNIVARAGHEAAAYLQQAGISWSTTDPRGLGPSGIALRTGEVVVCNDFQTDPRTGPWRADAARRGYAAATVLPLIHSGESFGCLAIYAAQVNAFHDEELGLLTRLAADLSFGVHSLRQRDARRRAEELLDTFFEQPIGLKLIAAFDGVIHRANKSLEDLLGYDRERLVGVNFLDLVHPDDTAATIAEMGKLAQGANTFYFENRYRQKSGEFRLLAWSASASTANQMIFAEATDITERRRVEEALRKSEAEFRLLAEAMPQIVWITRPDGWNTYFSPQWAAYTGQTLEDSHGHGWNTPFHPDDRQRAWDAWQHATTAGVTYSLECRLRRADGAYRWWLIRGVPVHDASGEILKWFGTCTDIDDLKMAEESHARLALAVEQADETIVITDTTGEILYANPAFEKTTGYTRAEVIGQNPRIIKSGEQDDAFYRQMWDALQRGEAWHGHFRNKRKDGTLYEEDATISPIRNASGTVVNYVAVKRDVTHERQLEAQYRQAQKMEGVGQLASGIAHDFNNLLTVINGMAELALEQVAQDDPVRADMQEIVRAGQRAAALTRQLLAFSRQQILAPRLLDINTVVTDLASLLRRLLGEDIDLVVVPTPGVAHVHADAGQLEQVITNLAVNARDAMPRGGRLTIEARTITIDETQARLHGEAVVAPGPYVQLAVSDSGTGMDEATRARIFEPFFTTKGPGKGTGLGLATVWGIVTQSHGFVSVDTEVGRGTSFQIFLPQAVEATALDAAAPTLAPRSGAETILIAEDNAGLRMMATRFLERAGYTVLGAATGEEALKLLAQHEAPVHLLLSDVVMPGMSGRVLAEEVAQTRHGMKMLYMSGYTSDTVLRHGVLDATVPFLNKPFTAASLLGKVREVLDS